MKARLARFLLVFSLACGVTVADRCPPAPMSDHVRVAESFLRSFYPNLSGKRYTTSIETSKPFDNDTAISGFSLYIGEGPKERIIGYLGGYVGDKPPAGHREGPMHPKQFIETGFRFGSDNHLEVFNAQGSAVGNPEVSDPFADLVLSHTDMTDNEVTAALKKAGAKYGPLDKDEFVKDLPIAKLERFLGKLTITSVRFDPLMENRNNVDIWPLWKVRVKAPRAKGIEYTYEIWFEAFKGDITSIVDTALLPATKSE